MRNSRDRLGLVNFVCTTCKHAFQAAPGRVEEVPEVEHHPYRYSATCPACRCEAEQAAWERALLKAWTCATGPKTAEGMARTAANLEGHPTPDEAMITRFNAMKHGLFSRVAVYFPAKPGKYPHCNGCEYALDESCVEHRACLKRTELFLKHQVAFDKQDPRLLMELRADTQAAIQALINDMILAITQTGVEIDSPVIGFDREGHPHVAQILDHLSGEARTVFEKKAHPLLKVLADYIQKNSLSLADLEMTPKSQDDAQALRGYLDQEKDQRQGVLEHQSKQTKLLENLSSLIQRSQQQLGKDAILAEYREVEDGAR